MKNKPNKTRSWLMAFLLLPFFNFAQEVNSQGSSYFSNPLFLTLLVVICMLILVIIGLGQALKNLGSGDFLTNKFKEKANEDQGNSKKITSLLIFLLLGYSLQAQDQNANDWLVGGLNMTVFYFMTGVILVEMIVIGVLYHTFMTLLGTEKKEISVKPKTKTILDKINASVDLEKEKDILLDHDYDGIKELDNDLPPWWKYGFYLTILFAVVYMIHYHVAGTGDLQNKEYETSLALAKAEVEEYMRTAADNVDETTVKLLTGEDIEKGKELFITSCAACHGNDGRGTVGPNLTDEYWLHGGSIVDIFKSVKYGWVDKGMKSWKEDLSPMQIAQITSFIRTIQGTDPAGAKVAQGDLYKEENTTLTDSTKVISDSLVVLKDTLK